MVDEWKRLVHFEHIAAYKKALPYMLELIESKERSMTLSQSFELKWVIKALLLNRNNPLLAGSVKDYVDTLIEEASQKSDLPGKQLQAVLIHCKSLLVFLESPELVYPLIEDLKELREGHEDDFYLLKYLVKTMLGY